MCTSIIVVILNIIWIVYIKDMPCQYCEWVLSIDQLLELMIRTSMHHQIHNKLEHKYARHYEILMKEAIIMYVTTYVGSNTEY